MYVRFVTLPSSDSALTPLQLSTFESANLERRSRGLTCEESCITGGGLWCDALGLEGYVFFSNITALVRIQDDWTTPFRIQDDWSTPFRMQDDWTTIIIPPRAVTKEL